MLLQLRREVRFKVRLQEEAVSPRAASLLYHACLHAVRGHRHAQQHEEASNKPH